MYHPSSHPYIHEQGPQAVARVGAVCEADLQVPDPPGFRPDLSHKNTDIRQSSRAHVGACARRRIALGVVRLRFKHIFDEGLGLYARVGAVCRADLFGA